MAQAYTPGLTVTRRATHRVRRILPLAGDVLVQQGEQVQPEQIVARTHMPGPVIPINLANQLCVPAADVPGCMKMQVGDLVNPGDLLAETHGLFGYFRSGYLARAGGVLESISEVTGQVILRGEPQPVQVLAYLGGTVVEVIPEQGVMIEADVTFIQGIFGVGGEAYGPVRMICSSPEEELSASLITEDMRGAVIVGGARMTGEAIHRAIEVGAAALISGGLDDQDLREVLGYDLGVAVTGSENLGTTLIVTEGFGEIAMARATFELFRSREGDRASVSGATQIRAGVMRPEILIPLSAEEKEQITEPEHLSGILIPGAPIRVIREPWFGKLGEVAELPSEPHVLESESKARVLEVRFADGSTAIVPRANVELIEQ